MQSVNVTMLRHLSKRCTFSIWLLRTIIRSYKFSESTVSSPLKHLDVSIRKFVAAVRLIDDLGDPDDVALVIADRHR